ncbi:uncharacterized protein LOC668525 isoform X3 [Mus musculus]|uniref:uncharacterized protein LOC668525 isoform X3 n=1 Tax=Mus musculus TaxID=10090 RepID=UPI00167C3AB3|nr:uncharacterized protein LOC668525 isoform X3 [Mus musculus]
MPDQISVSEFVAETHEDYKAPTASSFTTRTAQCRDTVAAIEEIKEKVSKTNAHQNMAEEGLQRASEDTFGELSTFRVQTSAQPVYA